MKDRVNNILQGATLLAAVLAMTGHVDANSRFVPRDSKFNRHTVQDAVECNPHTVQDCLKIPDGEIPRDDDEFRWDYADSTALRRFDLGSGQSGPHLALTAWSEPVDVAEAAGPAFDPVALPVAGQPEFTLPTPNEAGRRFVGDATGASIPGPGALPLLGLGTLALIGRRRRA